MRKIYFLNWKQACGMPMVLKYGFSVCILMLAAVCTMAQSKTNTLPQIIPKSPDVAAMETYGNVPVSESSGTADVAIPLTVIPVGSFKIPIGLSYHKNGLKVDDVPGSVGDGWMLKCTGMVSFQQHGLNDLKQYGLFYGGLSSTALSNLKMFFRGQMNAFQKWNYSEQVVAGTQDTEFDQFNYSFFGRDGSFYYDSLMNIITMPKTDLRISRTVDTIKITDNDENTYYFTVVENASIASVTDVEVRQGFNDISAYYLSKVVTSENRTILFKYKSYSWYIARSHAMINYIPYHPAPECNANTNVSSYDDMTTQSVLIPDSIIYDQGYVKFSISGAYREDIKTVQPIAQIPSLTGFVQYNTNGDKIKEFVFTQGYFGGNKRLKLSAVTEMDGVKVDKVWKFKYFNEESSPTLYSKDKDHWGYYNAAGNTSLIPDINYGAFIPGWITRSQTSANRNSSAASQYGMLQQIQYPTGGAISIEYELNQIKLRGYDQITSLSPFFTGVTYFVPLAAASTTTAGSVSGSFVIPAPVSPATATTVRIAGFATYDPSHFDDPTYNFTGPAGADLSLLYNTINANYNSPTPNQSGSTVVTSGLIPGTYTYSLTQGQDLSGGSGMTYNVNFSIEVEQQATPVPYLIGGVRVKRIIKNDSTGTPATYRNYVYTDSLSAVAFRNIPYYISTTNMSATWVVSTACSACGTRYTVYEDNVIPFAGSHIEYANVGVYDSSALGKLGRTDNTYLLTTNEYGAFANPFVAPVNTSWKAGSLVNQKIYKLTGSTYTLVQEKQNAYTSVNRSKITTGFKMNYANYCNLTSEVTASYNVSLATLFTEQFQLLSSSKKEYLPVKGLVSQTDNTFGSSAHTLPTITAMLTSKGELLKEKIIYSFDYDTAVVSTADARSLRNLKRQNILVPVEKIQYRTIAGTDYVVGGTFYRYREDISTKDRIYSLRLSVPVLMSAFVPSYISASTGDVVRDSRYITDLVFASYDEFNNVTSLVPVTRAATAYLYDYAKLYPVAEVANAQVTDVSYTSFEAEQKGNWTFTGVPVTDISSPTGSKCYNTALGAISKTGLTAGKTYLLSYWTKNVAAYSITGTVSGYPVKGRAVNGWTLFTHKITGVTSLSISGGYVDELRLYPADAMMKTMTYKPYVGLSCECDEAGNINYYSYDNTGRLIMIKDLDGKILKMAVTQYQVPITQ